MAWLPTLAYIKLDERAGGGGGNITLDCAAGRVFANPTQPAKGPTHQGFSIENVSSVAHRGAVRFVSSACKGQCLSHDGESGVELAPCAQASPWTVKEWA